MHAIAFWPTLLVVMIAVITDLRSRRIPNWLVVPFLLAGLLAGGATAGWTGIVQSLAGIGLAAAALGLFCYLRGLGMGDLKLCAAVGAWIGPAQLVSALVITAIAGGFLAVIHALRSRSFGRRLDATGDLLAAMARGRFRPHPALNLDNPAAAPMPYALAIAVGTIFSFYTV